MDGALQHWAADDGEPTAANNGQPLPTLEASLDMAVSPLRSRPGRPRAEQIRPRSLEALLSQASRNGRGRPATIRTLDNWRRGLSVPTTRKLRDTLLALGIRGRKAAPIVVGTARRRFQREAAQFEKDIAPLLVDPDGNEMHLSIETTVTLESKVRSNLFVFGGKSHDASARFAAEATLQQAQQLMRGSRTKIGWIALATGELTAPSPLMCDLVGMPSNELDGLHAIDPRLTKHMERILANFPEGLLTSALMFTSSLRGLGSNVPPELAERADRFYSYLRTYLADPNRYDEFAVQLRGIPDGPLGSISRRILLECLEAATRGLPWPTDWQAVWNTMRIHVKVHDLLPPGQVARFIKISRVLPPNQPIAYEVVWEAEPGNDVTHELVKQMCQRLGETPMWTTTAHNRWSGGD